MMGLQLSKHLVAESQFPFEPKRLIAKAELCWICGMIHFIYARDGSGDKTASLERVCPRSRSDIQQ